jgi:hypothetical protein
VATFTLASLLGQSITVGGVTLTNFHREAGTTFATRHILIETVEGDDPGINISVNPVLATTTEATQNLGVSFNLIAPGPILDGASLSLNGFSFATPNGGGSVVAQLTDPRLARHLDIDLGINNEPGGPDTTSGASIINGGPVATFRLEYTVVLDPNNGVAGTLGQGAIRFDLGEGLPPGFDGLQYIASYSDLAQALGANRAAGEQHYLAAGQSEGRQVDLFSETQYLKNFGDLQAAFGTNVQLATTHFIQNGRLEGRNDDAAAIDGLQYIASNPDLIQAFGANAVAGQQHYAAFGQAEGRVLDNFDETEYLANYTDLQGAFGTNTEAATAHFIQSGFFEGRNDFIV